MQPIKTYCTDAELAGLNADTLATLYIVPNVSETEWVTLGRLVKRAMEVLNAPDRPHSVEIQLAHQKSWLNSDQIRQLAKDDRFRDRG